MGVAAVRKILHANRAARSHAALALIRSGLPAQKGIRLVGVAVSKFEAAARRESLSLFDTETGANAASPAPAAA
jgi:hypothetical protein